MLRSPGEARDSRFKIDDDLPDGWQCAYRIVEQEGQPVVAELTIRHPGGEQVRPGGLRTLTLRQVTLGQARGRHHGRN